MKLINKGQRYEYYVSEDGVIYRKCGKGLKEVNKRLSVRGVLEFKMNGVTTSYRKAIATALIPNPTGADKVFSVSIDPMNSDPKKLYWVWTRENRTMTAKEALERTTDKHLIDYYTTGDKRALQRAINNIIERMYTKMKNEFLGDLYIQIHNYAERNLLFNLQTDIIGTYIGLVRQSKRRKLKTILLNEKYI